MASAPPPTEMEQEATCPICLEYLTDPMVLDCGHSFCQGCITYYCDKWEALGSLKCPVCKVKFQKGDFRRNWQLANLVEKMKLLPQSPRKEDRCLAHNKKLHLFCKEDEKLLCFLCERSPEHRGHTVLLLEEAAQQCKEKISNCLETLRMEREKILVDIAAAENESQEMLKTTETERQRRVAEFRSLHQLLNEQEKDLLAQIEEVEKEIGRKRDQHLARLSEELSSFKSLIQEMEEKHQQPGSELLRDVKGTLQRYEKKMFGNPEASPVELKRLHFRYGKKETFENTEAFPAELKRRVRDCRYNPFLESAMKQFKGSLTWAFPKLRAKVTLDPASASSRLVLSDDWKSMRWQSTAQDLFKDPEKRYGFVLGREGFTAGCHFWEIILGFGEGWAVGVARKPVRGSGTLTLEEGVWAVGKWKGQYKAFVKGTDPPLTLSGELKKIRLCLNYEGGRVSFFNADTVALLYEFSGASFCGKTLHPFFAVYGDGYLWLFP